MTRRRRSLPGTSKSLSSSSSSSTSSDEEDGKSAAEDGDDGSYASGMEEEEGSSGGEEEEEETDPPKIQRILACRSETKKRWREICRGMHTSEIDYGSMWYQDPSHKLTPKKAMASPGGTVIDEDSLYEERFLVKWKNLSHLHCSWETQKDLEMQVEGAKTYLNTFFRKSVNGLLLSQDERCDGDYFDPGYTSVERILEVQYASDSDGDDAGGDEDDDDDGTPRQVRRRPPPLTSENEDEVTPVDYGIVLDIHDPMYQDESPRGREFLVKWSSLNYSEATYEYERDLILNEIEYKPQLKAFLERREKPSKEARKAAFQKAETQRRKLVKTFAETSSISQEKKDEEVAVFQRQLQEKEYKNGGQLRDYQAEGVAWMISNFCNGRSVILAGTLTVKPNRSCESDPFRCCCVCLVCLRTRLSNLNFFPAPFRHPKRQMKWALGTFRKSNRMQPY